MKLRHHAGAIARASRVGTKLRDHLLALLAGKAPQPRGHVLRPEVVNTSAPFATACNRLVLAAHARDAAERVAPPSEALPPLP